MARRIILKEIDLDLGSNPPSGYKYLGFDGNTLSDRVGSTVSVVGDGNYLPLSGLSVTGNINMTTQPETFNFFNDLSLVTKKYVDDALIKPYKIYVALMTQAGTNAPTVTVLENTIGGIVWRYTSVGRYTGTLSSMFPDSTKVHLSIQQPSTTDSSSIIYYSTINTVIVGTGTSTGTATNDKITKIAIEIRVYD